MSSPLIILVRPIFRQLVDIYSGMHVDVQDRDLFRTDANYSEFLDEESRMDGLPKVLKTAFSKCIGDCTYRAWYSH